MKILPPKPRPVAVPSFLGKFLTGHSSPTAQNRLGSDDKEIPRFIVLDAMRGVAAVSVVVYYATYRIMPMAYAGVDLFFMLSGFVLSHSHGEELANGAGHRNFMIKRLIRLYPLYLVAFVVGAIVTSQMVSQGFADWTWRRFSESLILGMFFLPTPTTAWLGVFPLNGPSWSLFFELISNVVFGWTGWRIRPSLLIVAVSAPLLLWVIKWEDAGGGSTYVDFHRGFPRVFFSFFLGVVLYRLWATKFGPRPKVPPLLILFSMIALYAINPVFERKYDVILIFICHPVLIWLGAASHGPQRLTRAMTWLGALSYAVYIIGSPVQQGIEVLLRPRLHLSWDEEMPSIFVWLVLPTVLVVAHLMTFRFDVPVRARLSSWLITRRSD